jgi:hypothetical protein
VTTPQQPDALRAAQGLTAALDGVEARLGEVLEQGLAEAKDRDEELAKRDEELAKYGRRNRRLVIADIILTIAVTVSTGIAVSAIVGESHNAATVAELRQVISEVHQSTIASCQLGNKRAIKERAALDGILETAAVPKSAPLAEREASAAFEVKTQMLVAGGWASRNCAQIYRLP